MEQKNRIKYLQKQAFDFSSAEALFTNAVKSIFDPNDIVGSLSQLLFEGILAKYYWWLGALAAILDKAFGLNIKKIFMLLFSELKKLFINPSVFGSNPETAATEIAQSVISKSGIPLEDLNKDISEIQAKSSCDNEEIVKYAFVSGLLGTTLTGLLKSVAKAIIIGSGLSLGASVLTNTIRETDPNKPQNQNQDLNQTQNNNQPIPTSSAPKIDRTKLVFKYTGEPSGEGETYHENTSSKPWWIPNSYGDLEQFFLNWSFSIYPDLNQSLENVLTNNIDRLFSPIKREFQKYNPDSSLTVQGEYLRVPEQFKTVKDIVDYLLVITDNSIFKYKNKGKNEI